MIVPQDITTEELAKALVEADGQDPNAIYLPRGLKGNGTPLWQLYGYSRAVRLLELIGTRRAVEKALAPADTAP